MSEQAAATPAQDTTQTGGAAQTQEQKIADTMYPETTKVAAEAAPAAPETLKAEASTTEKKVEEAPKTEDKKVPEKYDLKLSEDSVLDSSFVDEIALIAKAQGLSNEQAQEVLQKQEAKAADLIENKKAVWVKELEADKEIGGLEFRKNAELAHRVVERFGTPTLKTELNKTGYGNHPELVRLLTRIGKAMSEDQLVVPGSQSGGKRDMADILYPNQGNTQ